MSNELQHAIVVVLLAIAGYLHHRRVVDLKAEIEASSQDPKRPPGQDPGPG